MGKKILIMLCVSLVFSCQNKKGPDIKNMILIIGDGMGPQQLSLLYYFAKMNSLGEMSEKDFAFKKVADAGKMSMSTTHPYKNIVTDSACSATQLATGQSSRVQTIGLDINGDAIQTILEKARAKGLGTGLVSDTRITHATPASFAAHVANRFDEPQIAVDLLKSQTDILLSGGASYFVSKNSEKINVDHFSVKPRRKDGRDLIKEAKQIGYSAGFNKEKVDQFQFNNENKKLLGLFADKDMPDGIWYTQNKKRKDRQTPSLLEMSRKAIELLSKKEKGFFLMIEGGQIDWTGHQNDTGGTLHEMISLNETVNWVHEWVRKHPDTVLIVTSDHETGNFAFGYNVLNIPPSEKLSGEKFKDQVYQPIFNYGERSTLDKIYQQKKTLRQMWKDFNQLDLSERNEANLIKMVKQTTGYKLSAEKSKKILSLKPNPYYLKWHHTLKKMMVPLADDFTPFYYEPRITPICLIGRAIGPEQSVTWGTGGHTATPVPVFSQGPQKALDQIKGFTNHTELGLALQRILGL